MFKKIFILGLHIVFVVNKELLKSLGFLVLLSIGFPLIMIPIFESVLYGILVGLLLAFFGFVVMLFFKSDSGKR